MAVFSKELCSKKLNTWLAAEEAVATGQSYQIGTRMLTRADLKQIRAQMEYWRRSWQRPKPLRRPAAETACTISYPVMCEEGGHGKELY